MQRYTHGKSSICACSFSAEENQAFESPFPFSSQSYCLLMGCLIFGNMRRRRIKMLGFKPRDHMDSNPIQSIVRARVAALMAKSDEAQSVSHMGMRGQLREKYLIEFFRDVIPQSFSITSGIICDASGSSSLQMDFIVTNDAMLPSMALHEDISIVPVEASLMTAEIKSTLTKDALNQVERQNGSISELRYTNRVSENSIQLTDQNVLIPSIILAYDCKVNRGYLQDFLDKNPYIVGICVVGQFSLLKLNASSSFIEPNEEKGQFWETLVFVGKLYHALQDVACARAISPNWDQYMQGYESLA